MRIKLLVILMLIMGVGMAFFGTKYWTIFTPRVVEFSTSLRDEGDSVSTSYPTSEAKQCGNPKTYSTEGLIECAFKEGKIDESERVLYLLYALGDYQKLPKEFLSKVPWEGTSVAMELGEIILSKEKMCGLSDVAQFELRKKFGDKVVSCP